MPKMDSITVVVERPDGSTYNQDIEIINDNVNDSIGNYKRMIGFNYFIVHWWVNYNE